MDKDTVLFIIAIIGCFVCLVTYLSKRDDRNAADAEWKGEINAKLDMIIAGNLKNEERFCRIEADVKVHSDKITAVEQSTKSAHNRLNDHINIDHKETA